MSDPYDCGAVKSRGWDGTMPTVLRQISIVALVLAGLSACADTPADTRMQFTATAPTAPTGAPEWSGQSGASGHPLMTADAIRAAAVDFPNCLARLAPDAARRGITAQTYSAYTTGMTPDLRLMDLMDAQPEFTKAFWEYLDNLVSEARIQRGRELLAQHAATFQAAEQAYGVDRFIITAIWRSEE